MLVVMMMHPMSLICPIYSMPDVINGIDFLDDDEASHVLDVSDVLDESDIFTVTDVLDTVSYTHLTLPTKRIV